MTDFPSIMSIRELIDTAFGESNMNIVNHKLIQTILIILARQLRLLERRVEIEIALPIESSSGTTLSVTEVKLHANVPRKKKIKATDSAGGGPAGPVGAAKSKTSMKPGTFTPSSAKIISKASAVSYDKTSSSATKSSSDKTSTGKSSSGVMSSATKSTTDKYSVGKTSSLMTSLADKTILEKTTSEKTTSEKTTSGKTTSDKSSSDKTSSDKTSSDKTSSDKTSTDKTSSDKTSTDKTSSDKTSSDKTSSDKTRSSDKTSSEKTSTDKTSSDKTSSDKTSTDKTSTDKTSTDKTSSEKSSSEKISSDATTTTVTKSLSDKTSTVKSLSEKKTTSDETKTSSAAKSSTEPSSSDKTTEKSLAGKASKVSPKLSSQEFQKLLEHFEEHREREMRIIHQRSDSREEHDKTPTPIASMESMERQYEKLLIVERVPSGTKAADSRTQDGSRGKTPQLSVVTQDEFSQLVTVVRQLQERYQIAGVPGFPENLQLLKDLRKGASLTDAMAALQLSARVEAAEHALERMMAIITEIIKRIYVVANLSSRSVEELFEQIENSEGDLSEIIYAATNAISQAILQKTALPTSTPTKSVPKSVSKSPSKSVSKSPSKSVSKSPSRESVTSQAMSQFMSEVTAQVDTEQQKEEVEELESPEVPELTGKLDTVTYEELDNALQELYDECYKLVTTATNKSNNNANAALKIAHKLEGKLDESLNLGDRMFNLEKLFTDYADQINTLDTGLSSQMTNYQEQLTHMQHDLEAGLESMAEALANTGGDTAAVGELNNHFTNLQTDIEFAISRQKELRDMQNTLSLDLQGLWKQIEILRDHKSDRDEVADALKDKAGLGALNGLVSRQEFDAVRGDFEKRIGSAYDKFNNQEIIWQKAIDDLMRELNEKADWIQVVSLQGSINQYLDKFKAKIRAMEEVVGEPRTSAATRKLHREAECLCCATPAHMDLEESKTIPLLPALPASRPSADGAEAKSKPKGDGDHGDICYPGLPVPHEVDPRAHVCHRYCGGSHTLINNKLTRAPVGMIISPALRKVNTAVGTDGKLYMVAEDKVKKPCVPCYKRNITPEPSEAEPAPKQEDLVSEMMSFDYRRSSLHQAAVASDVISETPPPPMDDD